MIKKIEAELNKLNNQKIKAVDQKTNLEKQIENIDTKVKKLLALKKKYELIENEVAAALNDE